jgi:preprotein translocase subunit SecF
MFVIKFKKVFVIISSVLVALSIISIAYFGLPFGIDFKGGTQVEISYENNQPTVLEIEESLGDMNLGSISIQPTGDSGFMLKTRSLSEEERQTMFESLPGDPIEENFNSIGPSVGNELARKSIIAFVLVALGIIFFIAFSFRKVSKPVSSWKYGLIAVATLIHDILIPTGIFVILSSIYQLEIDTLFVVAILTILGLSVSDTIVVFDRVRENLRIGKFSTFEETVGRSLSQVYTRSINTSLSTIIVLLCLVFLGPVSIKNFALVLTAGMLCGTYSSIFVASPLLVFVNNWQKKKEIED